MKRKDIEKYAKLIARVGINVQKGERVVISADASEPEFVRILADECYKLGAENIKVEFSYQPLTESHVNFQTEAELSKFEPWEIERYKYREKTLPSMIYLLSEDPDGLSFADGDKYTAALKAKNQIIRPIRDKMENKYKWCIAAIPGKEWAKKVFPEDTAAKAYDKLWHAIVKASRADGNPEKDWEKHNSELLKRCEYLNSLQIRELIYKNEEGTDFTLGLMENGIFSGGGENTLDGRFFNANIPSEEIYTTPKKGAADGIVYSTKPLSYRGELIENFSLTFKNGKAVSCKAEKNEKLLSSILSMDDGAAYLGECALVPVNSPISQSGLLFYNTLFDENASCHLALGNGFANCVRDFEKYSLAQCRDFGVNSSSVHVDFMIGSDTLSIDARLKDNSVVRIFENGRWMF